MNTAELKKQLEDALAAHQKAIEQVKNFESKLQEARRAEAKALTDDDADEKRTVKLVAEAQGLASVYSRRIEVARQKVPDVFASIIPAARELMQDLVNRCFALADTRAAAHRALFRPRLDLMAFHQKFQNSLHSFPVDFESELDQLIDCCSDVIAARACVPHLSFLNARHLPPDLTLTQLQWDLDSLEKAEAAYQTEAARAYNFEEPAEVPAAETVEV